MEPIYQPRGAAREYAPLAVNLYEGCAHGCAYCYAPAVFRRDRAAFHAEPRPRAGVIEALKRQLAKGKIAPADGPVLLCFTTDPYQPIEEKHWLTHSAVNLLCDAGFSVRILTKAPSRALAMDERLFRDWRDRIEVGTTLTDPYGLQEPHVEKPTYRIGALMRLRALGVRTWVSFEPILCNADVLLGMVKSVEGVASRLAFGVANRRAATDAFRADFPQIDDIWTRCFRSAHPYAFLGSEALYTTIFIMAPDWPI